MHYTSRYQSPLGEILLAADNIGLTGLWFYGQKYFALHLDESHEKKTCPVLGLEHMSAQAVGNAVAHNPVSVIVPCHRVLGSKGSLTGYAGGLERKIKLLELEKVPRY